MGATPDFWDLILGLFVMVLGFGLNRSADTNRERDRKIEELQKASGAAITRQEFNESINGLRDHIDDGFKDLRDQLDKKTQWPRHPHNKN